MSEQAILIKSQKFWFEVKKFAYDFLGAPLELIFLKSQGNFTFTVKTFSFHNTIHRSAWCMI